MPAINHYGQIKQEKMFLMILRAMPTIRQISKILEIFYDATISLQRKDLTLSDGYEIWLSASLRLNELKASEAQLTNLIETLTSELESRKRIALEFDASWCAQYLDPRFKSFLKFEEKQKAKTYVLKIWKRFSNMRRKNTNTQSSQSRSSELVDQYLSSQEQSSVNAADEDFILDKLRQFEMEPKESCVGFNIHSYWKKNKIKQPELYEISRFVYAIPPTQVVVERSFSDFTYILNPRRCRINEMTLETILNIRLNKQLVPAIFKEELEELKQKYENT